MRQGIRLGRATSNGHKSATAHVVMPPPFSLLRAMLRTLLLLLLVASVVYWLICAFGALTAHDLGNDFLVYFSAALALRGNPHTDIFDLHSLQTVAAAHGVPTPTLLYLYPPLLAILLIPMTFLPYRVALLAWTLLNLALWACGTALLVQWAWEILGVQPTRPRMTRGNEDTVSSENRDARRARQDIALFACTVTVLTSASFFPLLYGVINGQVTSLIFILSLLTLALLPRHPRLAAAALALAAWIKLFPIILVGYFLLQRRWRVVEGALLAGALLAVLSLLVVGLQGLLASTSILANGSAMAFASHASWNLSLALVPLWIVLVTGGEQSHALTLFGSAISVGIATAFAAGVVIAHRNSTVHQSLARVARPKEPGAWQTQLLDLLGVSWGLCTMVLLSPVAWMHTYAWLLSPSIICLSVALRALIENCRGIAVNTPEADVKRPYIDLLALIVLLVAYASLAVPGYTQPKPSFSILLHEQPLNLPLLLLHPVGALLLWGVNGLLFLRSARGSSQHETTIDTSEQGKEHEDTAGPIVAAIPSARFLALALMTLLVVVGAVEMLYWGIFLVVSTQ